MQYGTGVLSPTSRARLKAVLQTFFAVLWGCLAGASALAENATTPGELKSDAPTLRSLGFRWFIEGDDNGNASVEVTHREKGQTAWKKAQPMCRVNREVADRDHGAFTCGNLFAGSLLFLKPNTEYEAQFVLKDVDGGEATKTFTARTRAAPLLPAHIKQLHVYPLEGPGSRRGNGAGLAAALEQVQPSEAILLHAGIHKAALSGAKKSEAREAFSFKRGGLEGKPIVLMGAGDGEAIIDAEDALRVFDVSGLHHIWFMNLSLQNAGQAIKGNGSDGLVVQGCKIQNVFDGVVSYRPGKNWYIADNTITGRVENWYPRKSVEDPRGLSDATGVNVCGTGHVVCFNRVERFWDGVAVANYEAPKDPREPAQMCIDIHNNHLSEALDDNLECDYGSHNVRAWENLCINAHVGLSTQPFYGGPCYLIRNVVVVTAKPLKLHNYPQGLRIFQNTLISCEQGLDSSPPGWSGVLMNNLFFAFEGYTLESGSAHPRTRLDFNGYSKSSDGARFLKWHDGKAWGRYSTLKAFSVASGHERNGRVVDLNVFASPKTPEKGKTLSIDAKTFQLRASGPGIDAGMPLPNINDGFKGKAPDLGALEYGAGLAQFGPRKVGERQDGQE